MSRAFNMAGHSKCSINATIIDCATKASIVCGLVLPSCSFPLHLVKYHKSPSLNLSQVFSNLHAFAHDGPTTWHDYFF